jgi:hypothetical protein
VNENTWSGPARLRTSDKEREQVAEVLRTAMAEGRLTLEEGEERLASVYATKFRDELRPLTADLPSQHPVVPQRMAATRRGFGRHSIFVVAATAALVGLWILSGAHFFWPAIPLFFLLMGLARHARYGRPQFAHRVAPWNAPDPW